jgi:hypothetical protein
MISTQTIIIINKTSEDKEWGGFTYIADSQTNIEDVDRLRLLSDPIFYADYLAGLASISDGNYILSKRIGIGLLQNNTIILEEYYTLTQDDDILVGNGSILLLHDDKWEMEESQGEQEDIEE